MVPNWRRDRTNHQQQAASRKRNEKKAWPRCETGRHAMRRAIRFAKSPGSVADEESVVSMDRHLGDLSQTSEAKHLRAVGQILDFVDSRAKGVLSQQLTIATK